MTFDFWHLTFNIWHFTWHDIWHLTFDIYIPWPWLMTLDQSYPTFADGFWGYLSNLKILVTQSLTIWILEMLAHLKILLCNNHQIFFLKFWMLFWCIFSEEHIGRFQSKVSGWMQMKPGSRWAEVISRFQWSCTHLEHLILETG